MPHYWRPIDPDNPNRPARGNEVKQAAKKHGGRVEFVGTKKGTNDWYMLVDIAGVRDAEAMANDCKPRGRGEIYYDSDETPD